MGAVAKLPDDVQWSIRALLMRRLPNVAMLPRAPAPVPSNDPALPQLLGYLLQQMSKVNGGSFKLSSNTLFGLQPSSCGLFDCLTAAA